MRLGRRISGGKLGSKGGRRRTLLLSQRCNIVVQWVDKRLFGLPIVEEGLVGIMLSMRASSL